MKSEIAKINLFAWVGEDELKAGDFGLKQGFVPAGFIPMVSVSQEKLDKYWEQAERQSARFGKKIYLCKFELTEVIRETKEGK